MNNTNSNSNNSSESSSHNIEKHATADQLDILVSNAREISSIRGRDVKHLQSLLEEVEAQLD